MVRRARKNLFQLLSGDDLPQNIIPKKWMVRTLTLPKVLSVRDNLEATMKFFGAMQKAFLHDRCSRVILDHSKLEVLTPEAALMLIAECHRLKQHSKQTDLWTMGNSTSQEVEDLLYGVGYNDYFNASSINSPDIRASAQRDGVTFIKHQKGSQTSTEVASNMVDHFQKMLKFSKVRADRLKVSLGECMNNVSQHAYPEDKVRSHRWGSRFWWLLGYVDNTTQELYFSFLDQGVGLAQTLGRKWRDLDLLFRPTDAELVVRAFEKRRSRTHENHRGRGLTTLKKYIDQATDGELFVQSQRVQCRFKPRTRPKAITTTVPLAGTLLVWQVSAATNANNSPDAPTP